VGKRPGSRGGVSRFIIGISTPSDWRRVCWSGGPWAGSRRPARVTRAAVTRYRACDSHARSTRSTEVKRRRGRRERCARAQWRSPTISRSSAACERTKSRSEWSTETTSDTMSRAYSEPLPASVVTRGTPFL
jgi:hypothetical protein